MWEISLQSGNFSHLAAGIVRRIGYQAALPYFSRKLANHRESAPTVNLETHHEDLHLFHFRSDWLEHVERYRVETERTGHGAFDDHRDIR